jgi:hypothetical protein
MPELHDLEARAMATPGLPPGWRPWRFEAAHGAVICTGAVPLATYTRGPRKGEPNFRKRDPNTECKVCVVAPPTIDDVPLEVKNAIVTTWLGGVGQNLPALKMTERQREFVKAALRTLIAITECK